VEEDEKKTDLVDAWGRPYENSEYQVRAARHRRLTCSSSGCPRPSAWTSTGSAASTGPCPSVVPHPTCVSSYINNLAPRKDHEVGACNTPDFSPPTGSL
jgi:hypothetical protein